MRKEFVAGLIAGLAVVVLCAVVVLASPGDNENPLISKSYLDNVFMGDVKQYINQQTRFHVVELQQGQKLIGKAGCEFVSYVLCIDCINGASKPISGLQL